MKTTKTIKDEQVAEFIKAITVQPETAAEANEARQYSEQDVELALNGFSRAIIEAAVTNIKNTTDLIYFLAQLADIRYSNFEEWIEDEQKEIAQGLF